MKERTTWYSERVQQDVTVVRWGHMGMPLLLFPTAGGDAEEIERFHVISTLSDYLADGRIKIYSCDSVAGRVMFGEEGSTEHRQWIMDQFQEFVRWELVPAIYADCRSEHLDIVAGGASIGAFQALAAVIEPATPAATEPAADPVEPGGAIEEMQPSDSQSSVRPQGSDVSVQIHAHGRLPVGLEPNTGSAHHGQADVDQCGGAV